MFQVVQNQDVRITVSINVIKFKTQKFVKIKSTKISRYGDAMIVNLTFVLTVLK